MTFPTAKHYGHLCYTKPTWAESWIEQPLLRCQVVSDQAAPAHARAQLTYRYGVANLPKIGSRPADVGKATIPRASLLGNYVKVVIALDEDATETIDWYGVMTDTADDRKGDLDGTIPSGSESYTAYGLTLLLEKSFPVTRSLVKDTIDTRFVDIAIPFNGGYDGRQSRDRVASANYHPTAKCFTDSTAGTPVLWSAANAVEYLLEHFPPRDVSSAKLVPFVASNAAVLTYKLPATEYDGQNVWQILNRLIPRKRGLGFHATIDKKTTPNTVAINVFSHLAADIVLSDGTLSKNTNTTELNFTTSVNVLSATVTSSAIQTYDQFIVRGNNIGSVFTLAPDFNFEQGWTLSHQAAYNVAASATAGHDDLGDEEQASANADFRARDEYHDVFSHWVIPKDWDGNAIKLSDESTEPAVWWVDETGEPQIDSVGPFWRSAFRFEDFVPLRAQVDYKTIPELDDIDGTTEFLKPIVAFNVPVEFDDSSSGFESSSTYVRWCMAERLDAAADTEDPNRGHTYTVQTRLQPDSPGIALEVVGGQQHFIAADKFQANSDLDEIPEGQSLYANDFAATIYLPLQQRLFARRPEAPVSGDVARTLVIDIADAYLDRLIPGTVVGISDEGQLIETAGGWLRDDRSRLLDIAKIAETWYATNRKTIDLSFRAIDNTFGVGQLVTSIVSAAGTEAINTVVTSISIDLVRGTTTLRTQYEELDFGAIA